MNERKARGLKYTELAMNVVKERKLTDKMREFLLANMDGGRMTDELTEHWLRAEDSNWMAGKYGDDAEEYQE